MKSPFSEGRFEYDSKHCFYLPKKCTAALEVHKPVYLIGSRGSGKTTLLKSLNWKERVNNPTLLRQLSNDPFQGLYIGTYIKLPSIQLRSFDQWLRAEDNDRYGQILGLYFDLVFLETILFSISEMLATEVLDINSSIESDAVVACLPECNEVLLSFNSECRSMTSLHSELREARRDLEQISIKREPILNFFDRFAPQQIGVFSSNLVKRLADFCNHDTKGKKGAWHFKVCMDEGECLSQLQQFVVNTIVRLAEWPLFPIVSYVSTPDDITTTLIKHLSHQKADRDLVVLDTLEPSEYREFVEGVATVRCQELLDNPKIKFELETSLGKLDINGLLKRIIEKSENPEAKIYIEDAKYFSKKSESNTSSSLPIYQAYIAKKLNLPMGEKGNRAWQRHQGSKEYRKKMVAAYLSICRELRVRQVPYASAEMVLGISDKCVRDFLSQLDHIFHACDVTLEEFLTNTTITEKQERGIREASNEKRDSIPESGVLTPVETGRVVRGLALITALIQRESEGNQHLRSAERGQFEMDISRGDSQLVDSALRIVRDAADAGFLRIIKANNEIEVFRVHASLAPAYGFSYRGAYYGTKISVEDFHRLKSARSDSDLERIANSIASALPQDMEDLPLFRKEGGQ